MEVNWADASDKHFLVFWRAAPLDVIVILPLVKRGHDRCSNCILALTACSKLQDRLIHILSAVVQLDEALRLTAQCNHDVFLRFVLFDDLRVDGHGEESDRYLRIQYHFV